MTNESQIREILKRIDALHQDVEALLPKVEIPRPERSPAMCIHAATHGVPAHGRPVNVPSCPAIRVPSAAVKFFQRVADWFWVRGDRYSASWVCGDGRRMFSMSEVFWRGLSLWPIPSALGFFAWRSCARDSRLMQLRAPLMLIAALMAFAIVSAESYWLGKLHFPVLASGLMTIVWSLIAFGLLVLGVMRCLAQFRLCGLALLAVSAVKALLFDTASLATPARVAVFACVGALLIIGAFLYLRFRSRFEVFAK